MNRKRRSIYLCYALNFASAVCLTIISPSLPRFAQGFRLDLGEMGLLLTIEFIGFTAFAFCAGIVSDRIGKRKTVLLAMIILTIAVFLLTFSPNYPVLCIVLLFMGGGFGIMETMSNALLSDICDEGETVYQLNLMSCFFGIGAFIGPVLTGLAYSNGMSWRTVYQVLGFFLAALTLWFALNKLPTLPFTEKIKLIDIKNLVVDKKFLLICLCMFLYTGSEVGSWGWMSEFCESVMQFTVIESSIAVAVFWVAMTISRFVVARLLRKVDLRKFIMVLALAAGVISAVMGIMDHKVFVWIIIVLLGAACSSQWSMIVSYGAEIYKRNTGTVFAMLVASGGIGMSFVPGAMGFSAEHIGLRGSLVFPAALFALIAAVFIIIPKIAPKSENT